MRARLALLCLLLTLTARGGAQQGGGSKSDFIDNYLEVVGIGLPPKGDEGPAGYGLARRSAELSAYQAMAEGVKGVQIDSVSVSELLRLTVDQVTAKVSATLKACTVAEDENTLRTGYGRDGSVTVHCRVPLTGSQSVMAAISDITAPEVKKHIEEAVQKQDIKPYTPPPAPPAVADYDGLIVKVPARFKPCLYPKILTDKGEIVYSVNNVPDRILRSNGMAQYTNDVAKASALLKDSGVQNALTVDGFLSSDTEAGVRSDDAAKISSANKKTSFLSSAHVVFVVAKPS
jgi:hypothetical protein